MEALGEVVDRNIVKGNSSCDIGDNVVVIDRAEPENVKIKNSVVFPHSEIKDSEIRNSLIDENCKIQDKDLNDAVMGEYTTM